MASLDSSCPRPSCEQILTIPISELEQQQDVAIKSDRSFAVLAEETINGEPQAICVQKSPITCKINSYQEIVLCCAGNVDAGKSTILGSLVTGEKDDGKGLTRRILMNFPHEIETGRTSSIGHHILGFDSSNNLINRRASKSKGDALWKDVIKYNPTKLVSLVDLCGHESYLRTTIRAIGGEQLDYAMVVVSANDGIMKMTKQHLSLILQFRIPFCIVLTKIDVTPDHMLKQTLNQIGQFGRNCRKSRYIIDSYADLAKVRENESTLLRAIPIFKVSSVTGESMDLLRHFIGLLPSFNRTTLPAPITTSKEMRARIINRYMVKGIGTVVLCRIMAGTFRIGDSVYLGPQSTGGKGRYLLSGIRSIQRKKLNVDQAHPGETVTFALKKVRYDDVRIGMILVSKSSMEQYPEVWEFEANVRVVSGHTITIKEGYQPTVNIDCLTQCCTVMKIESSTGSSSMGIKEVGTIRFRFRYRPEYIQENSRLILRDGILRAVGVVTRVVTGVDST